MNAADARLGLGVMAACALAACGPVDDNEPSLATVRDSAGITIVEASQAVMETLPEWSLGPVLDLGGPDASPEHEFFRVNGALLLTDGTLVVVNSGSQEVRFFGSDGTLEASVGGEGSGPGEFRFPVWTFRLAGDSLLVFDRRLRRLSIISPEREIERTASLEGAGPNSLLWGILWDELVVVDDATIVPPSSREPEQGYTELLLFHTDGSRARKLGDIPSRRWFRPAERGLASLVFDPFTTFAVFREGIWIGSGRDYEVFMVDEQGQTTVISRWWGPDRTVTASDRDRWAEEQLSSATSDEDRARAQERVGQAVFAEQRGAYYMIWPAQDGSVWVQDHPSSEERTRWLVLDADGRPTSFVRTPRDFRMLDVVGDQVVGEIYDEFDVEHVVVYRMNKG